MKDEDIISNDDFREKNPKSPSSIDAALEDLEKRLEEQIKINNSNNFCWILLIFIIFDCFVFCHMESNFGSIVIGFFELILLVLISNKFNVDIKHFSNKYFWDPWQASRKN